MVQGGADGRLLDSGTLGCPGRWGLVKLRTQGRGSTTNHVGKPKWPCSINVERLPWRSWVLYTTLFPCVILVPTVCTRKRTNKKPHRVLTWKHL